MPSLIHHLRARTPARLLPRAALASLIFVLLIVPFAGHAAGDAAGHASGRGPTLLVMGDSLSAGHGLDPHDSWVALLENRLRSEGYGYAVVNASITGDTTTGGLKRLPRALELHRPALVIIELGGNDGLRATPVKLIQDNLARMIELCQAAGADVVLAGMQIPTNYGATYTRAFAQVYPTLAEEHDVGLIEFLLEGIALDPAMFQADGIHPNAAAQKVMLDNAWQVLRGRLRKSAPVAAADG